MAWEVSHHKEKKALHVARREKGVLQLLGGLVCGGGLVRETFKLCLCKPTWFHPFPPPLNLGINPRPLTGGLEIHKPSVLKTNVMKCNQM